MKTDYMEWGEAVELAIRKTRQGFDVKLADRDGDVAQLDITSPDEDGEEVVKVQITIQSTRTHVSQILNQLQWQHAEYCTEYEVEEIKSHLPFTIYEYDFFNEVITEKMATARTFEEASKIAKALAESYCEDEEPKLVRTGKKMWSIRGDSDYGAVIAEVE